MQRVSAFLRRWGERVVVLRWRGRTAAAAVSRTLGEFEGVSQQQPVNQYDQYEFFHTPSCVFKETTSYPATNPHPPVRPLQQQLLLLVQTILAGHLHQWQSHYREASKVNSTESLLRSPEHLVTNDLLEAEVLSQHNNVPLAKNCVKTKYWNKNWSREQLNSENLSNMANRYIHIEVYCNSFTFTHQRTWHMRSCDQFTFSYSV